MTADEEAMDPRWADHRLVLDAARSPEPVSYHVITSGRVEAREDRPTKTDGAFGHASGTLATDRHTYAYEGRLLSIKLRPSLVDLGLTDHRAAPFEVRRDGVPIDFDRWDPSHDDLPLGYGGPDALPADIKRSRNDCDRIASTREELRAATEDLDAGDVLGVDADIALPEVPDSPVTFRQDDLAIVGLPTAGGANPTLSRDQTPEGWGHVGVELSGDRVAVMDLQLQGSLPDHVPYDDYHGRLRGLVLSGADPVVINCHGWHWPHAAFSAGGAGETFLCIDAHHNMLGGLGYGFSAGGPAASKDWEAGETWSDRELTTIKAWHRRTEIKRVLMDANRHDVAGHRNASYELRWFVTGPTAVTGHRIDMHRPGGGTLVIGDGIVGESTTGVTESGEHGVVVRGWPEVGARIEDVWFPWGDAPVPEHRYPAAVAPIVQTCATAETRDRRRVWDTTNDHFIRTEWHQCTFGDAAPDDMAEPLRRSRGDIGDRWDVTGP